MRKRWLICSYFDDEVNVVMGLEMGTDDYISKPFRLKELMARIKSVMRRYSKERSDCTVRIRDLVIHPGEAKVNKAGKEIELTAIGDKETGFSRFY